MGGVWGAAHLQGRNKPGSTTNRKKLFTISFFFLSRMTLGNGRRGNGARRGSQTIELPPFQRISAQEATTCTHQGGNTGLVTDRVTAGRGFGKN